MKVYATLIFALASGLAINASAESFNDRTPDSITRARVAATSISQDRAAIANLFNDRDDTLSGVRTGSPAGSRSREAVANNFNDRGDDFVVTFSNGSEPRSDETCLASQAEVEQGNC